jgi:hypothetical protein
MASSLYPRRKPSSYTYLLDIESVVALPGIGIQLESQTGYVLPPWPLTLFSGRQMKPFGLATKTTAFIPLSSVRPSGGTGAESVFIHEALQRWNIRFYLGVMYSAAEPSDSLLSTGDTGRDTWRIQVLFPVRTLAFAVQRYHKLTHLCRTCNLVCRSCAKSITAYEKHCSTNTTTAQRPRHAES